MSEDYFTHTEGDAGTYERARALPADERPSPSELGGEGDPWRALPVNDHKHRWLPPVRLCAVCGIAKEVNTDD